MPAPGDRNPPDVGVRLGKPFSGAVRGVIRGAIKPMDFFYQDNTQISKLKKSKHSQRLRCIFSRKGRIFRTYFPLTLEVYNTLFFDSLGFMAVDEIRTTW